MIDTEIRHRNMKSERHRSDPPVNPKLWVARTDADRNRLAEFYANSYTNNAPILTWPRDRDRVLVEANRLSGNKVMHLTQRSIKGLEFDTVILHNIFSDPEVQDKLSSLTITNPESPQEDGELDIAAFISELAKVKSGYKDSPLKYRDLFRIQQAVRYAH